MALVYDFSFTADYAGCSATVIDSAGAEVSGSPVTLDATGKGSLTLAEGNYLAGTSNTGAAKNNAHANGVLNLPASIAAGGGGGGTGDLDRGTLYLKATIVNQDVSSATWADGTGAPFALVLDTDKQGATPIPTWADEDSGAYSIIQGGAYLFQIAGKGDVTYDDVPDLVYIDMYHNDLSGLNFGWASDGSENSAPFTPELVNDLLFGVKDTGVVEVLPDAVPASLAGLVGDNSGDLTNNPVLNLDVLLSITKIGSGPRFVEADI